jgi:hypothetical protein
MPRYYLEDITFTDQDDIVPLSGKALIRNQGRSITNTLAGNDIITAYNEKSDDDDFPGANQYITAFENTSTLNTAEGNDSITGIVSQSQDYYPWDHYGIRNEFWYSPPSPYQGRIDTGEGNDIITGIIQAGINGDGIYNNKGTINTGDGDDKIIGLSEGGEGIVMTGGTISTGDGQDTVTGIGTSYGMYLYSFTYSVSVLDTGKDNDIITGSSIYNSSGIINTSSGEDSIISQGVFINYGGVFLEDGNDSIVTDTDVPTNGLWNFNAIETGDGNDIITSTGIIYNNGVINTGNGDDSIIVDGGDDQTGIRYGILNYGGAINTGNGNDSIIANEGFESAENSSGAWFLGEGNDYIKGYGSGDFYGGNGNDTLELTPGTYTVGIWGEGGESPIFTKGNQLMITSEFEKLKAGSTIYDFTSLTAGQIIVVP